MARPGFITMHHPETGGVAEVAESTALGYEGRGWKPGPLPERKVPKVSGINAENVPAGDTNTPNKEG